MALRSLQIGIPSRVLPTLRSAVCTQAFHSSLPLFEETPAADGVAPETPKQQEKTIEEQLEEIKKQLDASSKEVMMIRVYDL